jgi:hypothetical protein
LNIDSEIEEFFVLFFITDMDQKIVAQTMPPATPVHNGSGVIKVNIEVDRLMLNTGKYTLSFQVLKKSNTARGEILMGVRNIIKFFVKRNMYIGAAPIIYESECTSQLSN